MPGAIDFALIESLVEEREALIRDASPEQREVLVALQQEIDERLAKAGRRNRMQMIMGMMYESLERLNEELLRLRAMTVDTADEAASE